MTKRIENLTPAQRAHLKEWADKWTEIGLRTGPADRPKFEAAAERCYRSARLEWHGNVVWVSSPIVMALAAPAAAFLIEMPRDAQQPGAMNEAMIGAVRSAMGDAMSQAIDSAVNSAVHGASGSEPSRTAGSAANGSVGGAIGKAVGGAMRESVDRAVSGAAHRLVDAAVRRVVDNAVRRTMDDTVRMAVCDIVDHLAVHPTVADALRCRWINYVGGQFWADGRWWGGAGTSFFREVCGLELDDDLRESSLAYEATMEAACWWYPHRNFLIACERPAVIHRELTQPGMHRLHCADGPAIGWPDGWGVYSGHGIQIPF